MHPELHHSQMGRCKTLIFGGTNHEWADRKVGESTDGRPPPESLISMGTAWRLAGTINRPFHIYFASSPPTQNPHLSVLNSVKMILTVLIHLFLPLLLLAQDCTVEP